MPPGGASFTIGTGRAQACRFSCDVIEPAAPHFTPKTHDWKDPSRYRPSNHNGCFVVSQPTLFVCASDLSGFHGIQASTTPAGLEPVAHRGFCQRPTKEPNIPPSEPGSGPQPMSKLDLGGVEREAVSGLIPIVVTILVGRYSGDDENRFEHLGLSLRFDFQFVFHCSCHFALH